MRLVVPLLLLLAVTATAQKKKSDVLNEFKKAPLDTLYNALKWRNIGPFRGGRANTICGVVQNDNIYYTGYTGGGIWKTINGGLTWSNISDGFFTVGSIGDIAVSEADPNVIYVGSGEHAVRGVMTTYGDGIYKSVDAGRTWKNMGLPLTRHIADVAIHPQNTDIVWVAAQGTVHGPSKDRGIYKSTDGGISWRQVLFINDSTGMSSLTVDMTNPRILYAASWQHQRYPWTVISGGSGSALWKSLDGGETWKKINKGLPEKLGKMGISVSRANPNRVYAIVESEKSKSGLYRSDDQGENWSLMSNDQDICSRSWYYMEVQADPTNENRVYVMNAPLMVSIDGGKTFSRVNIAHGDTHDLWINPKNTRNIALSDDGGGSVSYNQGASWSSLNNQPTAQFYRVNTDNVFPYKVYGGQQDNTSVIISSRNNAGLITERDWTSGPGCESAWMAFQPDDPYQVLGGCYQGFIEVLDQHTKETKDVQAYPSLNLAIEPRYMKYRFNWNAPIIASQHEKGTYYHAGNVLFKTQNNGQQWEVVSPDLTRNDTLHQGPGGGPLTNEGAGGENYNTINYVIESSLEKGTLWTGSDCGLVYLTRDGGKNWTNVTPPGLAESMIHSIELSARNNGTAFVCATRYKFNDYTSYTYRTTDFGKHWTRITEGIKTDDFIRVIREDPKTEGLLYAGAERGFYISFNNGDTWLPMQLNLPVVTITDLMIRDNDLVAATAGRAFWILDDLGPIQQSAGLSLDGQVKIFTPKPGYKFGSGNMEQAPESTIAGSNPPEGINIDYCLPEVPDSTEVKLEILNEEGKIVRTYTNKKDKGFKKYPGGPAPVKALPSQKGINRFFWDLRTDQVTPDINGVFVYGSYLGYRLPPGTYRARLSHQTSVVETPLVLKQDPNLRATVQQWQEQQQFLSRIVSAINSIHTAVNTWRKVKRQVESYNELLQDQPAHVALLEEGKKLINAIQSWESDIVEARIKNGQDVINWPSKLNVEFFNLKSLADTHDPVITEGLKKRLNDLEAEWNQLQVKARGALSNQLAAYNKLFKDKEIPAILQ
jgi:photosystem II stability/assembly factor-like uncharacterized protein